MEQNIIKQSFLANGGEMGKMIGSYNWGTSPVGPMEQWPQSLRNALNIILQSAFPMLLFWGEDLITFYNDAYTEILQSAERHPSLGKKAADIFPEGWDAVGPLVKKVYYEGETVSFEDQLIPIERNGYMEDVYWTFRYSPYYGNDGEILGVIISCAVTTDKVINLRELQQSKEELEFAIEATELGVWDVNPIKNTLKANNRLKEWFGLAPEDEVLLSDATNVIVEEDRPRVLDAINRALLFESGGIYNTEYDIQNPVTGVRRTVVAKGRTWFNEDKVAVRFAGTLQDVTEQVRARKKIEQSEQRFRNLVEEAIVATAILTGPDMVLELANEAMLSSWGRDASIIGKPLLEFMPELKTQAFPTLLRTVYNTGQPYIAHDALVILQKNGGTEEIYMDFSYKALHDEEGNITSILVMATDVTERVQVNRKVKQSEENLRNTILKAPVAMAIFKGEDFITEIANDKMLELWGKPAETVLGRPTFEAMPEVAEQGFDKILQDVYETGRTFSAQGIPVNFTKTTGPETVYLNFAFEPYRDTEGIVTGIIVVAVDVTEQVIARKKLEESEDRLRAVVESAPFPIGVYTGREMRIELANQSMLDTWGKGLNVISKRYSEILPELDNHAILKQLDNVYTTGIPFHARNERVDINIDGELKPFFFNYSFTPLYDASGKVYGVMNTAAEVTDLNIAKMKVEQSERNFRNMILQAPVAMCILLGEELKIDIANDFMMTLWGKEREDVMGKPLFDALPDAREQGLEKLLQDVYTTGEAFTASERPVHLVRFGKPEFVYQNFVYEPYRNSDGTILGILAISIDVTAQVLARQKIEEIVQERTLELESANINLERSNSELAQFAYITSHDLQEPVRKISIFTKMLESSLGTLEERPAGYITKIKNSADRMSNLIKDVLMYSRMTKVNDIYEKVALDKIIQEALTDHELVIEQRHAVIEYKGLPVVEAIPLQMSQLFGNLVSNSLKYSKADVPPVITISSTQLAPEERLLYKNVEADREYYKIEFKDNGIGFEPEYAEKIFNIFQRLHTKSEYSGTGIGLAMCKKILENHHGDITAYPREEGGAVFNIVLPVQQN